MKSLAAARSCVQRYMSWQPNLSALKAEGPAVAGSTAASDDISLPHGPCTPNILSLAMVQIAEGLVRRNGPQPGVNPHFAVHKETNVAARRTDEQRYEAIGLARFPPERNRSQSTRCETLIDCGPRSTPQHFLRMLWLCTSFMVFLTRSSKRLGTAAEDITDGHRQGGPGNPKNSQHLGRVSYAAERSACQDSPGANLAFGG